MADLLKDMYNYKTLTKVANDINYYYPEFNVSEFINYLIDENWESLELKSRVRKISNGLGLFLPNDYVKAINILNNVVDNYSGFFGIIFPDFVEVYGQDKKHLDVSLKALEDYTAYSSSEFAIRAFLIKYEQITLDRMLKWSMHENEHVRRLASEGVRPLLPWATVLEKYKNNPLLILPILNNLKNDDSKYVKKSVANCINDISKNHSNLVIDIAKKWYGSSENTNWIVKHGCRTLLKQGNQEIMILFGYCDCSNVNITNLSIDKNILFIGDDLNFSFDIKSELESKIRIEYQIDFVKANGSRTKKVFKISEIVLSDSSLKKYKKKHSFKDLTTRKHYPGVHTLTIKVNGISCNSVDFELSRR